MEFIKKIGVVETAILDKIASEFKGFNNIQNEKTHESKAIKEGFTAQLNLDNLRGKTKNYIPSVNAIPRHFQSGLWRTALQNFVVLSR